MERKKYLLQNLEFSMQTYLELSDIEVNLMKLLLDNGWLYSNSNLICLNDVEYINPIAMKGSEELCQSNC